MLNLHIYFYTLKIYIHHNSNNVLLVMYVNMVYDDLRIESLQLKTVHDLSYVRY
jgi:hypothetical protein